MVVAVLVLLGEGSLEIKFPTIWTDQKPEFRRVREEKNQRRERVRRHKVQMREKVAMLRNTVFLLHFCYAVGLRLKPPIVLSGNLFLPGPGSRLHLGLISFLTSFFFQAQIPRGHVYTYVYTAIRDINRLMRPEHP